MDVHLLDNEDQIIIARTDEMIIEIIQKWYANQDNAVSIRAAGALFVRMSNSWKSICKLLDGCSDRDEVELYSNDSAAILRCLHDASLQAEYILAGDISRELLPDELGKLYLDFETVERHKMMTKGVSFSSTLAQQIAASSRRVEGEAKLQQDYDRIKEAYSQGDGKRTRSHWYKGNLPQIAEKLGREEEHFWFLRLFDGSIHAGPLAVISGPVIAGANLLILASNLICHTAKILVATAKYELTSESTEVIDATSDDLLNIGPPPSKHEESGHDTTQ